MMRCAGLNSRRVRAVGAPQSGSESRRNGGFGSRAAACDLLEQVQEVPFQTAADSLLIDVGRPHEAPMEEFRTLRTRPESHEGSATDPQRGGD
jgi:hypothetical protein